MAPFPKAKVNGLYILKDKIGQGSFGQVFKGKKHIQLHVLCLNTANTLVNQFQRICINTASSLF